MNAASCAERYRCAHRAREGIRLLEYIEDIGLHEDFRLEHFGLEHFGLEHSAGTSDWNPSSGSPELSRAVRRGSLPGSGANASIASDSVR